MVGIDRYIILLRGNNFLLNLDGDHAKVGFYATRIIKSTSSEEAERIAVIRIYQELNKNVQLVKNIPDSPAVSVEKTEKLGAFQFIRKRRVRGFSFHPEEDAAEVQSAEC